MSGFGRFLLYNLGASLAAGLLAWLAVMAALRLLRAKNAFLYASFLALPLVKSILVLLGIGLVFPWRWFSLWQRLSLPPQVMFPILVGWLVLAGLTYRLLVRRVRIEMLAQAHLPDGDEDERLKAALACIRQAYQVSPCCQAGETVCCISDQIPQAPHLLVSERVRSPAALVEGGTPVIIFPVGLLSRLDDQELAFALAHELNHFALHKPGGWSAGNLRLLALISPVALLIANTLHREEEKACDDLAVRMLGTPAVYASMLMKSYQFARNQGSSAWRPVMPLAPELLGGKPFLSKRIERLLEPQPEGIRWYQSRLVTWPIWMVLLYLLFFARFGP